MSEKEYLSLKTALASARMEGFEITGQTELDCARLLNGEVSVSDLVYEVLNRPTKAV